MRKQVTKPRQAASKSTLDAWQRRVQEIIAETTRPSRGAILRIQARAKHLLASMEKSELR